MTGNERSRIGILDRVPIIRVGAGTPIAGRAEVGRIAGVANMLISLPYPVSETIIINGRERRGICRRIEGKRGGDDGHKPGESGNGRFNFHTDGWYCFKEECEKRPTKTDIYLRNSFSPSAGFIGRIAV